MKMFTEVDEQVARNPIARAVARQAMRAAVRDLTIGWYIPAPAVCPLDVDATHKTLAVSLAVLELHRRTDEPAAVFLRLGAEALERAKERGYAWQAADAPCIDTAMQFALDVLLAADAQTQQRAWVRVNGAGRD